MTRPSGSPRRLVRNTKREGRSFTTCPPPSPRPKAQGWCPDSGFWFFARWHSDAYVCELLLAEARQHLRMLKLDCVRIVVCVLWSTRGALLGQVSSLMRSIESTVMELASVSPYEDSRGLTLVT